MSIFSNINRRNRRQKAWLKYCVVALTSFLVISSIFIPPAIATPGKYFQPPSCVHTLSDRKFEKASISFLSPEKKALRAKCETTAGVDQGKDLKVTDEKLVSRLNNFLMGDRVNLTYNEKDELLSISTVDVSVPTNDRLRAFSFAALFLFLASFVALGLAKRNILAIRELFVGYDQRLSNSKSQAAIWFFVLIVSYLSITYVRIQNGGFDFVGGISIPQNLLLLSGISAFTFAGSMAITQSQVNRNPNSKPIAAIGTASLADYFLDDDDNTDFGDFQMSIITLLAVVVFLVQIFNYIGVVSLSKSIAMPDLDTTILALFGLGQGSYLAKKAVAASGATDFKALKVGVKDKKVIDIKKALNYKLSLKEGDALDKSEEFDDKTEQNVIKFQQQEGLSPADGIVDATTLDKLLRG
jgi:hypothetical protein